MIEVGDPIPVEWTRNAGPTRRQLELNMVVRFTGGRTKGKLYRVVKAGGGAVTIEPAVGSGGAHDRHTISPMSEMDYRRDVGPPYDTAHYSCDGQREANDKAWWGMVELGYRPATNSSDIDTTGVDGQATPVLRSATLNSEPTAATSDASNGDTMLNDDTTNKRSKQRQESKHMAIRQGGRVTGGSGGAVAAKAAAKSARTANAAPIAPSDGDAGDVERDAAGNTAASDAAVERRRKQSELARQRRAREREANAAEESAATVAATAPAPATETVPAKAKGGRGPRFYSLSEAAQRAGLQNPLKVNEIRRGGHLPEGSYKTEGRAVLYSQEAIDAIKAVIGAKIAGGGRGRRPVVASDAAAVTNGAAPAKRRGRPPGTGKVTANGPVAEDTAVAAAPAARRGRRKGGDEVSASFEAKIAGYRAEAARNSKLADNLQKQLDTYLATISG